VVCKKYAINTQTKKKNRKISGLYGQIFISYKLCLLDLAFGFQMRSEKNTTRNSEGVVVVALYTQTQSGQSIRFTSNSVEMARSKNTDSRLS
jgi:hypothetical protein